MFIETLEFTIPVDLCDIFSTMKRGPQANFEFPASVNSYGTTQDANVQVVLRANKLTFKVDGVSSDASMISKSECRTLKLSVFDVDRSLMPFDENDDYHSNDISTVQQSMSAPLKRTHEQSISIPSAKNSRTSYSDSPRPQSPPNRRSQPRTSPRPTENSQSKSRNHNPVNVKQEPEDPDLIEIEPDPEDVVPKTETPYMQIDYSSTGPCTQTSQAALDRLSYPQTSQSQSSSSSSFHQNVPHVPDYAEPGPSQQQSRRGDQSADDYLVFQGEEEGEDNEGDYSNDVWPHRSWTEGSSPSHIYPMPRSSSDDAKKPVFTPNDQQACVYEDCSVVLPDEDSVCQHVVTAHANAQPLGCQICFKRFLDLDNLNRHTSSCPKLMLLSPKRIVQCEECGKWFASNQKKKMHINAQHRGIMYRCGCGQVYSYSTGLDRHRKNTGHLPLLEAPAESSLETMSSSVHQPSTT